MEDDTKNEKWDVCGHKPNNVSDKKSRLSQIKVEGHLKKWINVVRGWKRNYFSLKNGVFKYSHKQKDIEEKALLINLTNSMILKERRKHSCRFVIDTGTIIFNLRAKSYEERETWVSALAETQELLVHLHPDMKESNISSHSQEGYHFPLHSEIPSIPRKAYNIDTTPTSTHKEYGYSSKPIPPVNPYLIETGKEPILSSSGISLESLKSLQTTTTHALEKIHEKLQSFEKIKQQLDKSEDGFKKKKHGKANKEDLTKLREELLEIVDVLTKDSTELIQVLGIINFPLVVIKKPEEKVKSTPTSTESESKEQKLTPRNFQNKKEDLKTERKTTNSDEGDSEEYFDAEEDVWNASGDSSSMSRSADHDFFSDLTVNKEKNITEPPIHTSKEKDDILKKTSSHRSRPSLVASLTSIKAPLPRSEKAPGSTFKDVIASVPDSFRARTQLPYFRDDSIKLNIAKFLKDAIGKDLTRISMPVVFSEPLSLLQRLAEEYASYSEVLDKVTKSNDPGLRLAYVAAFAVSCYSSTPGRLYKPFNSILGETYELIDKEKRWRLLTEQVSHHPPVSACICEGDGWTVWGHAEVKTKFWGKSLEITPVGSQTVSFPHTGDQFVWNKVTTIINNVILGSKWVDHYGDMIVLNHTTGDKCKLNFEKTNGGWLGSSVALSPRVTGIVYDKINQPLYKIEGTWTDSLDAIPFSVSGDLDEKKKIRLWERAPWPSHLKEQYNYTSFAIAENELPTYLKSYLPITDSRWRTDQRAFENGDFDLAQEEKTRMEEVQRRDRLNLEANNIEYKARWFKLDNDSNTYVYKGGYWEQRMKQKWEDVSNVFGLDLNSFFKKD